MTCICGRTIGVAEAPERWWLITAPASLGLSPGTFWICSVECGRALLQSATGEVGEVPSGRGRHG